MQRFLLLHTCVTGRICVPKQEGNLELARWPCRECLSIVELIHEQPPHLTPLLSHGILYQKRRFQSR
jgi:hypothetical protein